MSSLWSHTRTAINTGYGMTGGKLVKGSKEAKAYMAYLRSLRRKGPRGGKRIRVSRALRGGAFGDKLMNAFNKILEHLGSSIEEFASNPEKVMNLINKLGPIARKVAKAVYNRFFAKKQPAEEPQVPQQQQYYNYPPQQQYYDYPPQQQYYDYPPQQQYYNYPPPQQRRTKTQPSAPPAYDDGYGSYDYSNYYYNAQPAPKPKPKQKQAPVQNPYDQSYYQTQQQQQPQRRRRGVDYTNL